MFETKDIVSQGKTDDSRPLIVRNRVFDRYLTTDGLTDFSRPKYLFLQLLRRGMTTEEAARRCDMTLDDAVKFRDSPKAQEYLTDRYLASILAEEAKDPDRFWTRLELLQQGHLKFRKDQVEALKEAGRRIAPITDSSQAPTKIEITIDADAMERARAKRRAIDAEVVTHAP